MDAKDIYTILDREHPYLSDDMRQELAIKIWEKRDKYDGSSPLGAWIYTIVKRFIIDNSRRKKTKENNLTNVFSELELITDEGIVSIVCDKITDGMDPLQIIIEQEKYDIVMERVYNLPKKQKELILQLIEDGEYELSETSANKVTIHRAKINLKQIKMKKEKKYNLTNVTTGAVFAINTFGEAAKIVGCTAELAANAHKRKCLFAKKQWRIS